MGVFDDKVVVITGAGGGLGKAHAIEFAKRGAKVVVNDLGGPVDGSPGASNAAEAVVEELRAMGAEAVANRDSVADPQGAKNIIQTAVDAFGTVDILVNNAGILRDRSFKNMTIEDWDAVINVHLNGSAYVTHAAWPIMYAKNYGRIVLTSSGSGIYGNFGQANYGAAKMGMLGLMNVLALEGASHNVRVNTLVPAAATRMTNTVPGRDENVEEPPAERHPRLVSPAVLYMCTEDAPNGAIINAGNGRFYRTQLFVNEPVKLGASATFEDLLEHSDELMDMSAAKPFSRAARRQG